MKWRLPAETERALYEAGAASGSAIGRQAEASASVHNFRARAAACVLGSRRGYEESMAAALIHGLILPHRLGQGARRVPREHVL